MPEPALPEPPLVLQLVPLLAGLLLGVAGAVGLARGLPRWRRAVPADGVVVHAGQQTMVSPGKAWRLTIGFTDATGVPRQSVWVGNSTRDTTQYQPGTPVPVRYDPQDPAWVWLPGDGRPHPLLLPAALLAVGLVVLVGFLAFGPTPWS